LEADFPGIDTETDRNSPNCFLFRRKVASGDPVPGALSPLYKGQLLVHGLGYSPDAPTHVVLRQVH
jgi:hypothetical protein